MHVEDDYYCKLFDCKLALLLKQELLVIVFTGMSTISIICVALVISVACICLVWLFMPLST